MEVSKSGSDLQPLHLSPDLGETHYVTTAVGGGVWYAVHTKSQAERLTADALNRKGFEAYLPMVTKEIRHARQKQVVARPLFNRYLFVSLDRNRPLFSEVRKTHGVDWIVCNSGKPIQIPTKIIENLRRGEEEGLFDETRPKPKVTVPFQPGDTVRISEGPFEDFVAQIMAAPSDRRIDVILSLFGRKTKVKVPVAHLQPMK